MYEKSVGVSTKERKSLFIKLTMAKDRFRIWGQNLMEINIVEINAPLYYGHEK